MFKTRYLAAGLAVALLGAPILGNVAFAADDPTPSPTTTSTPSTPVSPPTTTPVTPPPTPSPTPTPTKTTPPKPTQATTAVRNIRWEKISDTSVKLSWTDPADLVKGETVHYYVRTTISLGGAVTDTKTDSDTTENSVTYTKLQPGSVLRPEVTTRYRYAKGLHDYGPTYSISQKKPGVVTQLDVQAIAHNKSRTQPDVSVTFSVPDPTNGSGTLIDKYEIKLYNASTDKVVSKKNVTDVGVVFTKVDYTTQYYVTVRAHNSAGYGPSVKSKVVVTAEKVLYPEVLIPLPKLPGTESAPKPTQSATPKPTPTPSSTAAASGSNVNYTSGVDGKWLSVAIGVAVIFGIVATYFTVLYYRRHPWQG